MSTRYNFGISNIGMDQMLTTSFNPMAARPRTAAELKRIAMEALAAWQEQLKGEQDAQGALDTVLASLAEQIKDQKETAAIDAAIRKEWLERNKEKSS